MFKGAPHQLKHSGQNTGHYLTHKSLSLPWPGGSSRCLCSHLNVIAAVISPAATLCSPGLHSDVIIIQRPAIMQLMVDV